MKFILKYWMVVMAVIVIALFLWLRFYNIRDSFVFTGDPGRDMLVLWDWKESGKPPLLGPQTSALPLNQSAIYFYFLYPAFLLSGANPMSANITLAVFWLVFFVAGLWGLRKRPDLQWVVLIVFALSSIHPLFVAQTRTVWNPSFVPPLMAAAFISLFLMSEKFTLSRLLVFSLSISLAVSMNFSTGAFLIASFFYIAIFWKNNRLLTIISCLAALAFFNLPTLVFELRHGFLITKSVLGGHWLGVKEANQVNNLRDLLYFSGGFKQYWANFILILGLATFSIKRLVKKEHSLIKLTSFVFLTSIILTLLSKLNFHSHYIFGYSIAIFILISQLPSKLLLPLMLTLFIIWVNPGQTESYYAKSRISIDEMESCTKKVCESEKDPLFVSLQAVDDQTHVGYKYRFLMKKNGCEVRSIETEPTAAEKMAVVVDGSTFKDGKTSFYELSLFGKSKLQKTYQCGRNFEVVILSKD